MIEVISEDLVHRYVDGPISWDDRETVESLIQCDERAAALLEALSYQTAQLRRAAEITEDEPVPSRLRDIIQRARAH